MENNDVLNFFDNYKFFYDPHLCEIKLKFICNDCKRVITKNELGNYQIPVSGGSVPQYQKAKFWCNECYNKKKQEDTTPKVEEIKFPDKKDHDDVLEKAYSSLYNSLGVSSSIISKSDVGNKLYSKYHQDNIDAKIYAQKYFNDIPKEELDKLLKANNSVLDISNEVKKHGI